MFDWIKGFKDVCPNCKTKVTGFQSKDGSCGMNGLWFWEVNNFYADCSYCNTWIEYTIKKPVNRKKTIKDYKRVVKIPTKKEQEAHRAKYRSFAKMLKPSQRTENPSGVKR